MGQLGIVVHRNGCSMNAQVIDFLRLGGEYIWITSALIAVVLVSAIRFLQPRPWRYLVFAFIVFTWIYFLAIWTRITLQQATLGTGQMVFGGVAGTLLMVLVGLFFYALRRYSRLTYGIVEVFVAAGILLWLLLGSVMKIRANSISNLFFASSNVYIYYQTLAGFYFFVRGLDNVGEGLRKGGRMDQLWQGWFPIRRGIAEGASEGSGWLWTGPEPCED